MTELNTTPGATFIAQHVRTTPGLGNLGCRCDRRHAFVVVTIDGHWEGGATDRLDLVLPADDLTAGAAAVGSCITSSALHALKLAITQERG